MDKGYVKLIRFISIFIKITIPCQDINILYTLTESKEVANQIELSIACSLTTTYVLDGHY